MSKFNFVDNAILQKNLDIAFNHIYDLLCYTTNMKQTKEKNTIIIIFNIISAGLFCCSLVIALFMTSGMLFTLGWFSTIGYEWFFPITLSYLFPILTFIFIKNSRRLLKAQKYNKALLFSALPIIATIFILYAYILSF